MIFDDTLKFDKQISTVIKLNYINFFQLRVISKIIMSFMFFVKGSMNKVKKKTTIMKKNNTVFKDHNVPAPLVLKTYGFFFHRSGLFSAHSINLSF